jgi:peptidoglycan/LPS O-acetylase OafA/YrhL
MQSSSGTYYPELSHIRAIAAYLVVAWHFISETQVHPDIVPIVPFAILDQGHTGVSLFMTLSGYIFAKLMKDKEINYPNFIWNRAVRLLPLLTLVIILVGLREISNGESPLSYGLTILRGILYPTLPNGGWSITVEFHFYLIFPLLLFLFKRSIHFCVAFILIAILVRYGILEWKGSVQNHAYLTIIGRIDQFVLGILFFNTRSLFKGRYIMAGMTLVSFLTYYWIFDLLGGFYGKVYPSESLIWVFMTTIEGLAYGLLIAWYDQTPSNPENFFSKLFAKVGDYSYSVYLIHPFFVGAAIRVFHDINNIYIAICASIFFYLLVLLPAHLTFSYIESPPLRYRRKYAEAVR